tara:strand:+ start:70 stop:249 length:180 start_codon:yes stop_codon:yes gene_type:complete
LLINELRKGVRASNQDLGLASSEKGMQVWLWGIVAIQEYNHNIGLCVVTNKWQASIKPH